MKESVNNVSVSFILLYQYFCSSFIHLIKRYFFGVAVKKRFEQQ